jgi:hypothetical protein
MDSTQAEAQATQAAAQAADTPLVLKVKLDTGDELEIDAGGDRELARAELASFHADVATHEFVRFDDDTVVRSTQIAYMQLREREQASGGLVDAVKSRIGGGSEMSTYGTDPSTMRVPGAQEGTGYAQPRRQTQPLFDTARGRGVETKPFFLTSEFLTTVAIIAGLAIAMQTLDNFDADRGWLLITIAAVGYVVSRGIAKAGSRSYSDDPRERLGWGDGDR